MTVLFAFVSRSRRVAFLGSDDLEGTRGGRCDKVIRVGTRYVVACFGADSAQLAAQLSGEFGDSRQLRAGDRFKLPDTTRGLVDLVATIMPRAAARHYAKMVGDRRDPRLTDAHVAELKSANSSLVIIDLQALTLSLATFSAVFPPRSQYTPALQSFTSERAYRFAIDEPLDLGPLDASAIQHPFDWCSTRVAEARQLMADIGQPDVIGELGACFHAKPRGDVFRTAFSSLEDAMNCSGYPLPEEV